MKETKAGPKNHRMSFCWTNDCKIAAHEGSKLNWLALMQGPEVARCDKISIKSESSVSDTDVTSDDEGFLVESHLNWWHCALQFVLLRSLQSHFIQNRKHLYLRLCPGAPYGPSGVTLQLSPRTLAQDVKLAWWKGGNSYSGCAWCTWCIHLYLKFLSSGAKDLPRSSSKLVQSKRRRIRAQRCPGDLEDPKIGPSCRLENQNFSECR